MKKKTFIYTERHNSDAIISRIIYSYARNKKNKFIFFITINLLFFLQNYLRKFINFFPRSNLTSQENCIFEEWTSELCDATHNRGSWKKRNGHVDTVFWDKIRFNPVSKCKMKDQSIWCDKTGAPGWLSRQVRSTCEGAKGQVVIIMK